jgi:hypothetical protein
MTFEEFKELKTFGRTRQHDIEDYAVATIIKYPKIDKAGNKKQNAYNYQYSVHFLYENKERKDNSKEFKTLKAMKDSLIPLFNSSFAR